MRICSMGPGDFITYVIPYMKPLIEVCVYVPWGREIMTRKCYDKEIPWHWNDGTWWNQWVASSALGYGPPGHTLVLWVVLLRISYDGNLHISYDGISYYIFLLWCHPLLDLDIYFHMMGLVSEIVLQHPPKNHYDKRGWHHIRTKIHGGLFFIWSRDSIGL